MADKPVDTLPELSNLDPTPIAAGETATATTSPATVAPPQSPRPQSPRSQAKATLKEAFPNVDDGVIEAVLIASGGNIEPAFNALLAMTDPTYKPESTDAVPRHSDSSEPSFPFPTSTPRTQLEQDEQLARQLAGEGRPRRQDRRSSRDRQRASFTQQQGQEKEHSFIDDDLPIIKDNIKKGWSTFLGKVKSKLDGEPEQPPLQPPRPAEYGHHQQRSRYDADPRVLGDDFSHLSVQDQSAANEARQSHRPLANPNLFKSARFSNSETNSIPPAMPPRPEKQSTSTPAVPPQSQTQTIGGPLPSKKWEPLRPAEDRDPFAVGDSDDEQGNEEDLYGTAPAQPAASQVGTQESGTVHTALDAAINGKAL